MRKHDLTKLEALLKATVDLVESPTEADVLKQILDGFKELGFDRARLYLLSSDHTKLVGKAESGMDREFVGLEWPLDIDPHTQRLIKHPSAHIFNPGSSMPDRFRELLGKTDALQWAEVPLVVGGQFTGKISVDNKFSGRPITRGQLQPLALFAQIAAVALQKAALVVDLVHRARDLTAFREQEHQKADRLAKLARAIAEMIRKPATIRLRDRLTLIARHATDLLNTETCGVLLVSRPEHLRWVANWGHREGFFREGWEFPIKDGPRTGLTGYMASQGRMLSLYGDAITNHHARSGRDDASPSGRCHSILGVPLFTEVQGNQVLAGFLRATNKKDHRGVVFPATPFNSEDESIMQVFAEATVAAIESATLVDSLREKQEFQHQLIASSPEGIIAFDATGEVKVFNREAERILGYSSSEILGSNVRRLYPNGEEFREGLVNGQLALKPGHPAGYETEVQHKDGRTLPIRLFAFAWSNEEGKPFGRGEYFQDLRPEKVAERRQTVARRAIETMAEAPDPPTALSNLARELVENLPSEWSQILFLSEDRTHLEIMATHSKMSSGSCAIVSSWPKHRMPPSQRILELLENGAPVLLAVDHRHKQADLDQICAELGLPAPASSVLIVPLRIGRKFVGLLVVGTASKSSENLLTEDDIRMASEMAAQSTVAIEPMRWFTLAKRHNDRLEQLSAASHLINQSMDSAELRQVIVQEASRLFDADYVTLWPYDAARKQLLPEQLAALRIPPKVLQGFREDEPTQGHSTFTILRDGHWTSKT
jgi:PAS domain S-box-containing protein